MVGVVKLVIMWLLFRGEVKTMMPKCPLGNIGDNVNYCMFAYNNMKKQLELDLKEAMNDKSLGRNVQIA